MGSIAIILSLVMLGQSGALPAADGQSGHAVGGQANQPNQRQRGDGPDDGSNARGRDLQAIDDSRRGPDARRDQILQRRRLQPVDAGIEDRNQLDVSLRRMQAEPMSMPIGFSRVYIDPADPSKYVRGHGALYAVFPHSEYLKRKKGTVALIPLSTTFRIGLPAHMSMEVVDDPSMVRAPERVEGRYDQERSVEPAGAARLETRVVRFLAPVDVSGAKGSRGEVAPQGPSAVDRERAETPVVRSLGQREYLDEPAIRSRSLPLFLTDENYRRTFFKSLRHRQTTEPSSAG
jgi:hypothetical protein